MDAEIRNLKKRISDLREEIAISSARKDGKYYIMVKYRELKVVEDILKKKVKEKGYKLTDFCKCGENKGNTDLEDRNRKNISKENATCKSKDVLLNQISRL